MLSSNNPFSSLVIGLALSASSSHLLPCALRPPRARPGVGPAHPSLLMVATHRRRSETEGEGRQAPGCGYAESRPSGPYPVEPVGIQASAPDCSRGSGPWRRPRPPPFRAASRRLDPGACHRTVDRRGLAGTPPAPRRWEGLSIVLTINLTAVLRIVVSGAVIGRHDVGVCRPNPDLIDFEGTGRVDTQGRRASGSYTA